MFSAHPRRFRIGQRVYPKTHCLGIDKSMGLQWALSDGTLVAVYDYNRAPRVQTD